jgi:hypothetical protein
LFSISFFARSRSPALFAILVEVDDHRLKPPLAGTAAGPGAQFNRLLPRRNPAFR